LNLTLHTHNHMLAATMW